MPDGENAENQTAETHFEIDRQPDAREELLARTEQTHKPRRDQATR
jgi:hypothetical protein